LRSHFFSPKTGLFQADGPQNTRTYASQVPLLEHTLVERSARRPRVPRGDTPQQPTSMSGLHPNSPPAPLLPPVGPIRLLSREAPPRKSEFAPCLCCTPFPHLGDAPLVPEGPLPKQIPGPCPYRFPRAPPTRFPVSPGPKKESTYG